MEIEIIRTLMLITQGVLLAIQITTGFKWLFIPIVLLMFGVVALDD